MHKIKYFSGKKIIKNIYVPTGIHYLSFSDPLPKTPLFSMDLSEGLVSSLNVVNQVRTAFVKKKSWEQTNNVKIQTLDLSI